MTKTTKNDWMKVWETCRSSHPDKVKDRSTLWFELAVSAWTMLRDLHEVVMIKKNPLFIVDSKTGKKKILTPHTGEMLMIEDPSCVRRPTPEELAKIDEVLNDE